MYVQPRHQIGCSRSIENRNKKHYQHFIIVNCSMNLRHEMLLLAFLSHPIIKLLFLFIFIFSDDDEARGERVDVERWSF